MALLRRPYCPQEQTTKARQIKERNRSDLGSRHHAPYFCQLSLSKTRFRRQNIRPAWPQRHTNVDYSLQKTGTKRQCREILVYFSPPLSKTDSFLILSYPIRLRTFLRTAFLFKKRQSLKTISLIEHR